jgi:hypothetical protein
MQRGRCSGGSVNQVRAVADKQFNPANLVLFFGGDRRRRIRRGCVGSGRPRVELQQFAFQGEDVALKRGDFGHGGPAGIQLFLLRVGRLFGKSDFFHQQFPPLLSIRGRGQSVHGEQLTFHAQHIAFNARVVSNRQGPRFNSLFLFGQQLFRNLQLLLEHLLHFRARRFVHGPNTARRARVGLRLGGGQFRFECFHPLLRGGGLKLQSPQNSFDAFIDLLLHSGQGVSFRHNGGMLPGELGAQCCQLLFNLRGLFEQLRKERIRDHRQQRAAKFRHRHGLQSLMERRRRGGLRSHCREALLQGLAPGGAGSRGGWSVSCRAEADEILPAEHGQSGLVAEGRQDALKLGDGFVGAAEFAVTFAEPVDGGGGGFSIIIVGGNERLIRLDGGLEVLVAFLFEESFLQRGVELLSAGRVQAEE